MRSRGDQLADFYAREHRLLERAVAGRVNAPTALIEDACAHAWTKLAGRDDIDLDRGGYWWLYTVAIREGWLLSSKSRREPTIGLDPTRLGDNDHYAPNGDRRDDVLDAHTTMATLPQRQQRLLVLQAAGYTYREIAAITGDTLRTVERQLLRAKRRVRRRHLGS